MESGASVSKQCMSNGPKKHTCGQCDVYLVPSATHYRRSTGTQEALQSVKNR